MDKKIPEVVEELFPKDTKNKTSIRIMKKETDRGPFIHLNIVNGTHTDKERWFFVHPLEIDNLMELLQEAKRKLTEIKFQALQEEKKKELEEQKNNKKVRKEEFKKRKLNQRTEWKRRWDSRKEA